MQISDLEFSYPPGLIAVEPSRPTRVMVHSAAGDLQETDIQGLLEKISPYDLFVVNETKVIPARVFSREEVEILFLRPVDESSWEVLFPSREFKIGDVLALPGGVEARLTTKGLPQLLTISQPLTTAYFDSYGEMALPPYIQEARAERHNRQTDTTRYQTEWAVNPGSVAAPTASLHFTAEQLASIPNVARLTLHVGAGTFFPIRTTDLSQHQMHSEKVEMPLGLATEIKATRARGGRVWALGTTVARALESIDRFKETNDCLAGETNIFIYPPYQFKNVDVLLTNFHQPRSTLLALVSAFAGQERVKHAYQWAIEREFKLFSYGDLSAWIRP